MVFALLTSGYGYMLSTPATQQQQQRSAALVMKVAQSRRYVDLSTKVDKEKLYDNIEDAVALSKTLATAKFTETMELHANLDLDPKYNDQQIRTTVSLPAGTGNTVRVAVLAEGPAADAALAAGADIVGMNELIETISSGVLDFDVLLATPPAMPKLAKLGKVLGPKGLMPSPKAGTVSADPGAAVAEFKAGKIEFRTDKQGIIHVPFGKSDFSTADLEANLAMLVDTIEKSRPTGCKGKLWNTAAICSTMGPAVKLDLAALKAFAVPSK